MTLSQQTRAHLRQMLGHGSFGHVGVHHWSDGFPRQTDAPEVAAILDTEQQPLVLDVYNSLG